MSVDTLGMAVLLGAVVGALLGLVGGGGSILAVPALVYGLGLPLEKAIPTSLIVVGAASAIAVIPRLKAGADWRLAGIIGVTGIATAFAGTAVNALLDSTVLLLAFATIMILAGIRMFLPIKQGAGPCGLADGRTSWRKCAPRAVATGAVVGFLTGLLGVGGGFLIVPALTIVLGIPAGIAVTTSLLIIVMTSAAAFLAHAGTVTIDGPITVAFAASAMTVSVVAARLGRALPDLVVRKGFAVLVLMLAAGVIAGTIFG